jgi:hypothetical protein
LPDQHRARLTSTTINLARDQQHLIDHQHLHRSSNKPQPPSNMSAAVRNALEQRFVFPGPVRLLEGHPQSPFPRSEPTSGMPPVITYFFCCYGLMLHQRVPLEGQGAVTFQSRGTRVLPYISLPFLAFLGLAERDASGQSTSAIELRLLIQVPTNETYNVRKSVLSPGDGVTL